MEFRHPIPMMCSTIEQSAKRCAQTDTYTHGHHTSVVSAHAARTAENSAAFLLPSLKPGAKVLDVGCGPGSISIGLGRHVGPEGHVTAIDCADEVVQMAKEAVREAEVQNVVCETASVYALPYEANSFDVVFAHQVLQHLSDPVSALKELKRMVKPGGLIAIRDADYSSMRGMPELPLLDEFVRIYRATARRNDGEPDAGRHLVQWMCQAGIPVQSIKYTASVAVYEPCNEPAKRLWSDTWSERCLHSAFASQAVEYGLASKQEMEALSRAWKEWAADPESIFQFVNGEALARIE